MKILTTARAATARGGAGLRRVTQSLRHDGPRGFARRAVRKAYITLGSAELDFPLLPGDVADSETVVVPTVREPGPGVGGVVGWLMCPPALGSGGHTTVFRMIRALEAAGTRCVVLLYDRHGGDPAVHARTIRQGWPDIRAEIVSVDGQIRGVDACVATSWDTAHVLAARAGRDVRPLYFIQDFEPYFYPRGSTYALAEDTYRFGFRNVALGRAVADALKAEVGVPSDEVPFGCDTRTYRLDGRAAPRSGVVVYCKPDVARRGYVHARLALEEFHRRHPEQPVHAYGARVSDLNVPVAWHGRMWPDELNDLYNTTLAGIAMSFTNVSLVAGEMLAAGTIPVVNDSPLARADLDSPYVAWARPTPHAIADALSRIVEDPDPQGRAAAAAGSVPASWDVTGAALVRIVHDSLA